MTALRSSTTLHDGMTYQVRHIHQLCPSSLKAMKGILILIWKRQLGTIWRNRLYGNSSTRSWKYTSGNSEKKQIKRHKRRRIDSKPKESQSIPGRNNYEALATNDSDVEDMQEGTDYEIPENTEEEQSKKNEVKKKTARPQKQEEFKHKVAPIIIKETAKWTKTSNMMESKNIAATKCKLIEAGFQVESATEDDYKKDDGMKDDLQLQDYPVEKISQMRGTNGQPIPLVLIEVSREYESTYNIATTPQKYANCQGERLSIYIKCSANSNNTAINKKFIDASLPKVNPWTKKMRNYPVNHNGEPEEKLALILRRMELNINSTNAATEQN
ncbi:hypothetical protein Trydic_g8693 [Trypoxylus dichotomus]